MNPVTCSESRIRAGKWVSLLRMTAPSNSPRYGALAWFLIATFAAAAVGTVATFRGVTTWYPLLAKPAWTPPSALFGPVWTALYIAMAVAAWRVWRIRTGAKATAAVSTYGCQLLLNALWSVLFFGLRRPDFALIDIVALWAILAILLVRYWRADRWAGALWTPYFLWVSFASALNGSIWDLNR